MTATTPTKAKTRPVSATVMAKASSVNSRKVTSSPENQKITKKLIATATAHAGQARHLPDGLDVQDAAVAAGLRPAARGAATRAR